MEEIANEADFSKLKRELVFVLGKVTVRFEAESDGVTIFFCGGMNFILRKKNVIWFKQAGNQSISDFFIHHFKSEADRNYVIDFITSKGKRRN
jgi:hypothetical protein